MKNKDDRSEVTVPLESSGQALRRQAEEIAREKAAQSTENHEAEALLPKKTRQMLHELRVHQIELEMQNEELKRTQLELDAARTRYFDLYDLAPVGYCTISEKGLILEANLTAAILLNVTRSALVKQPFSRFILKEDQDIYYLHCKKLFETGEPQACELRMAKNDGTSFWVRMESSVVQDADGTPEYRIVMSNITERYEAEERLRASLTEKEVLLKEVHHRVKNNLQVISSLISLQADSLADEQLQGVLGDVKYRVRAMALVHEKLYQGEDLSRLDFADYALSLLNDIWGSHSASNGNVRLTMSLSPLILAVDTAVLCGLILNELCCNTIKHAFPGGRGGEVTVTLEHDPATGAVSLRMHDNGVGLPADLDWRQSTSLGLRLVQMLAKQMRGTVQTGSGPGTEFQVNFFAARSTSLLFDQ